MEAFSPAFEHSSPGIEVDTAIGRLLLTHYDTRIRTFGQEVFDHVEHSEEGVLVAFQVPKDFLEELIELDYPNLYMPYVDEASMDWYMGLMTKDLKGGEDLTIEDLGN